MNNLPVTVQAVADTSRAAKSLENLTRKREVILAASFDARSIAAANKPLGAIKRSADEFEKSMAAANARVLAFGTSVAVIEGMRRSFLALIKTTADVQEALTKINIVGGEELKKVGKTLDSVGKDIFDLAKRTGQSFDVASKAFLEFTRQGLGPVETLKRTEVALNVVRVSGEDYTNVVEGLTAAFNSFKQSGLDYTKIADKIIAVDNAAAVSSGQLIEGLKRSSATAQQAGTNIDELIATITVLQEVTARGGGVIGNSIKSISTRLQRPDVLKYLEEMNVQVRDVDNGKLLNQIAILKNVSDKLQTIDDTSKRFELAEKISGLYQIDQLNAFVRALQDAGSQGTRFEQIMRQSAKAGGELSEASAQFSQNLVNKFAAVDITIQRVLNSLGKIGIIDPLSGLLDSFVEVGEGFSKFLDGNEIGSGLARGIVKGLGAVLLGPTGVVTVGFIIAKIIKDFGVFAFDAAKSFLSLNKTAKDQELIQKSILTTISQMPSILNGIENTESGRLLLAQKITAEYEKQFAAQKLFNDLSAGASKYVYNQGVRVTDKGLTRIKGSRGASGYLPDLISSEMRDVKNGVGGANPNSKIVVMPNFPFGGGKKGLMVANSSEVAMKMGDGYGILNPDMMGKRAAEGDFPSSLSLANTAVALKSGKFAPIKKIEAALNKTISEFLDLGNGTKGLYQEIQKTLKDFKLTGNTFKEVSVAANDYARELVKNKRAAKEAYEQQIILNSQKKKEQAELFRIQKLREESVQKAGAYASSMAPPAALSAIPYMGLGFMGSTSAKNSSSFGSFAPSQSLTQKLLEVQASPRFDRTALERMSGSILAQRNYASNPTAAFGGTQRLESQGVLSPLKEASDKAKGSLESFAIKTFAASAIVDIVGAQFRGASETTDKLIDAFSRATLAVAGFSFLSQRGGMTLGKVFEGAGGFFGGIGKKAGGGISSAVGAISTFGKSLVRFLPIIGQVSLAGFVINEFSKVFSDRSLFDRIKTMFTGVTEAGEKARDRFNEIVSGLFSPSGEFQPKTDTERKGAFEERAKEARAILEGERRGIMTGGKSAKQIAEEGYRKTINDILGSVLTGNTIQQNIYAQSGKGSIKIGEKTVQETFADITGDAGEDIRLAINDLISGDVESIRNSLKKLGIEKAGGKLIKDADAQSLQKELGTTVLNRLKKSVSNIKVLLSGPLGKEQFSNFISGFIPDEKGELDIAGVQTGTKTLSPEVQKNIQKIQDEIRSLIFDGTISALESEIKALEFQASQEGVSDARKNRLLNAASDVQRRIFSNQRQQALGNIQARAAEIRSSGKEPEEINAELKKLKIEYANQRLRIRESELATKRETDERNRAADSLNRFNSSLNSIQGFISTLGVRGSVIDAEGQRLRAKASNPSLGILSQENFQRQINQNAIASLENQRAIAAAERSSEFAQNEKIADLNQRAAAEKESSDKLISRNQVIDAEIDAIKESTSQIGNIKSSFVALDDAILQFSRNLDESRGQNQFNLLQATDANSIVQGLIGERVYDSAGGKAGAELVSFIADQNALLNEQFKIRTASSEVEKLELERQLDLTQQLLDIKNSNLSVVEKQAAIEGAINANLEKRRTFSSGVQDATAAMRDRVNNFGNEFGKTTANAFRDGLSDAIKAAVSQTGNLKDALLDVALAFANKLRDAAIDNLVDSLMSGGKGGGGSGIVGGVLNFVGGLFNGGIQTKAAGGMVRGGSGTKDDVPTLLMGGEYVIPKNVVNSYGKTFFDRIRDGSVGKMAAGGYFAPGVRGQGSIVGKDNLLDFATQTATSGSQDVRQTLRSGAGLVSLEPESLRMSSFARFGDSPIVQATQEAKEQAFGLYLDQLGQEKQYQEELAQYYRDLEEASAAQKKAKKDKQKQLLLSLASAVIGGAISSYSGGAKSSKVGETRYSGSRIRGVSERPFSPAKSGYSFSSSRGSSGRFSMDGIMPLGTQPQFDYREMMRQITANIANGGSGFFKQYDLGTNRGGYYGSSLLLPPVIYTPYRNSGGYGNGDTRQAMLSKDEFVLNSSASKNLGDKALYALNNGVNPSGESDDSAILAKLDELIQKTSGQNSISVTVNTGKESDQTSSEGDSDSNQRNRMLAEKIKTTVLQIMRDEKRPGGLLTK